MQCVLVDGSQLLLSLSLQLMLLNGSSPPAVNWLGKFPRRIPWRRLASARCTVANGGHLNRQYPYLLPSPPLLPMLHQQLSALSHPSMQFTSQQAGATRTFQHTYAHAEEFRCRETSTACACISHTSKSLGLYRSKSLQLGIEIQQKKNPQEAAAASSALPSWQVAHSMKDQNTLIIHHKVKILYLWCVCINRMFFLFQSPSKSTKLLL